MNNREMEERVHSLEPFLERADMIGYGAARNTRILLGELTEYLAKKNDLIVEYGNEIVDDDGNPTGQVQVSPGSDRFPEFADKVLKLQAVEHDPPVFKVPYSEAIGVLTGAEILQIDWMLEEEGTDV